MGAVRSIIVATCGVVAIILWAPAGAMAASHTVDCTQGDSIQAAVDAAAPGDVIKVLPGDCIEPGPGPAAVRVTKPLKLIAKSILSQGVKVRILPGPGQTDGIVVEPENPGDPDINRILIKGFTVEGFSNNGIWLKHTTNFKIKNNEAIDNLENGIWPTLSAKGLVKNNVAYGSQDSALWVEASEKVRVIKNELHHAPTGLEVTISENIFMKGNDIHDNTVGVGLYHSQAAGLPVGTLRGNWRLIANNIHDNNEPNTAPGGQAAELLPGIGVLVIGTDDNLVQRNTITGNDFVGIAMLDWCLPNDCVANPPTEDPDTAPEGNRVIDNTVTGNGTNPPPSDFAPLASDILALVNNTNCFSGNTFDTSIPSPLTQPECS
jgi:parallel beta-helix repeat protein